MNGPVENTATDSGVITSIDGFYLYPMKFYNTFGSRVIYCKEDVYEFVDVWFMRVGLRLVPRQIVCS